MCEPVRRHATNRPDLPETEQERVHRVLQDRIALVAYDSVWPTRFADETAHLRSVLPGGLLGRIEHYGSTAVPGMVAKPIVDMLIEVTDVDRARAILPEILAPPTYDWFWRPLHGDHGPRYSWLIKRDAAGARTHHLHCIPDGHELWEGLVFRDRLRARPELAAAYAALKQDLAQRHADDRIAYTMGKTDFIRTALTADDGKP